MSKPHGTKSPGSGWHGKRDPEQVANRNEQRQINDVRSNAEIAREYDKPNTARQLDKIADQRQAELDKKKGG